MRAIFMGKHKRSAVGALEHLVRARRGGGGRGGARAEPGDEHDAQRLDLAAERHGLRLATDDELYAEIADGSLGDVDLVLSFLFWKRIRAAADRAGARGAA